MTGQGMEKWADEFMFPAEKSDAAAGPQVYLLSGGNDPLGQIAACAKMYMGEVVRDLSEVTDEERRHYAEEMKKTKLKMPLEAVSLHFMIEGVTRGFTHQMVRQRTAAYAQESTRFAVKEDMTTATALPPSLAGTVDRTEWVDAAIKQGSEELMFQYGSHWAETRLEHGQRIDRFIERFASSEQKARFRWDAAVSTVGEAYMDLVNTGMPAEDARGLMPTNITTRLNYITNLRGLLDHAGNRLCTQAQFEWRVVFAQIAQALRAYGEGQEYRVQDEDLGGAVMRRSSAWQYEVLAGLLQPVCYQTGKCEFKADFDRKCKIRDRVDAFADHNIPSSQWGGESAVKPDGSGVRLLPIYPVEWLADPAAAR